MGTSLFTSSNNDSMSMLKFDFSVRPFGTIENVKAQTILQMTLRSSAAARDELLAVAKDFRNSQILVSVISKIAKRASLPYVCSLSLSLNGFID